MMHICSAVIKRLRQTFEWLEAWKSYKYNAMADVIIFDITVEHYTMLMQFYGSWDAGLLSAQAELVPISASEDKLELLRGWLTSSASEGLWKKSFLSKKMACFMKNMKSSNTSCCICILYGNLGDSHEEVTYWESEVKSIPYFEDKSYVL